MLAAHHVRRVIRGRAWCRSTRRRGVPAARRSASLPREDAHVTRLLCNGGAALVLLVSFAGLLAPGGEDEHGHKAAPADPLPAHARAPHGVNMVVDKPDKQVAWIKDIERK